VEHVPHAFLPGDGEPPHHGTSDEDRTRAECKRLEHVGAAAHAAVEQHFGAAVDRLDDFFSVLAFQFTNAGDWAKAREYLIKAGDQAVRIAADAEGNQVAVGKYGACGD